MSILSVPCREPVLKLEEPDDYTVYCLQTDKKNLIASGSSLWGVVRLWDKRMTRTMQVSLSQDLWIAERAKICLTSSRDVKPLFS